MHNRHRELVHEEEPDGFLGFIIRPLFCFVFPINNQQEAVFAVFLALLIQITFKNCQ